MQRDETFIADVNQLIADDNRYGLECLLKAELAQKHYGCPYSQDVIEKCREYLTMKDFDTHAGKGPAPCSDQ